MSRDRRFYNRISVDTPCLIYSKDYELTGKLVDLSEEGAGILLNPNQPGIDSLFVGMSFFLYIYDSINFCGRCHKEFVVCSCCVIAHGKKSHEGIYLGCRVKDRNEFVKYVDALKMDIFLQTFCCN